MRSSTPSGLSCRHCHRPPGRRLGLDGVVDFLVGDAVVLPCFCGSSTRFGWRLGCIGRTISDGREFPLRGCVDHIAEQPLVVFDAVAFDFVSVGERLAGVVLHDDGVIDLLALGDVGAVFGEQWGVGFPDGWPAVVDGRFRWPDATGLPVGFDLGGLRGRFAN